MEGNNVGGVMRGTPGVSNDLEYHDKLPRKYRDFNNYYPFKFNSNVLARNLHIPVEKQAEILRDRCTEATRLTYGPDHPQAQSCQHSPSSSTNNAKPRNRSSVIADKYIPCGSSSPKQEKRS